MMVLSFDDPICLPGPRGTPAERFEDAFDLDETPGQTYLEKRCIPVEIAKAAGVRFDPDFNGRPAVIAALRNPQENITAVHARYLHHEREQNKMLTIGPGGGLLCVAGGWRDEPIILVEGLFDALSLAVCGWSSAATIGRWAPWLPAITAGRTVWIGFDATRPGEIDYARYTQLLPKANLRRLLPPPRCKDWNTALVKRGRIALSKWLEKSLTGDAIWHTNKSISRIPHAF